MQRKPAGSPDRSSLLKAATPWMALAALALPCNTACAGTPTGLSGSYVDDTVAVAQALLQSIDAPGDGPDRAQQQSETKALINDYVALYRPNGSVNGLASFTTMQTAVNSLAGYYTAYGSRPIPEKLKNRLKIEFKQAKVAVERGV
jgi:photosystem II Psb27 protein